MPSSLLAIMVLYTSRIVRGVPFCAFMGITEQGNLERVLGLSEEDREKDWLWMMCIKEHKVQMGYSSNTLDTCKFYLLVAG